MFNLFSWNLAYYNFDLVFSFYAFPVLRLFCPIFKCILKKNILPLSALRRFDLDRNNMNQTDNYPILYRNNFEIKINLKINCSFEKFKKKIQEKITWWKIIFIISWKPHFIFSYIIYRFLGHPVYFTITNGQNDWMFGLISFCYSNEIYFKW